MTYDKMLARIYIRVCCGGCGISDARHWRGIIDPFGTVHFDTRRRWTRRGARNLLLLVAKRDRLADPGYLNVEMFDWWYQYADSVMAQKLARMAHFQIPARLFEEQRERCRLLAAKRGVHLSHYRRVKQWLEESR